MLDAWSLRPLMFRRPASIETADIKNATFIILGKKILTTLPKMVQSSSHHTPPCDVIRGLLWSNGRNNSGYCVYHCWSLQCDCTVYSSWLDFIVLPTKVRSSCLLLYIYWSSRTSKYSYYSWSRVVYIASESTRCLNYVIAWRPYYPQHSWSNCIHGFMVVWFPS